MQTQKMQQCDQDPNCQSNFDNEQLEVSSEQVNASIDKVTLPENDPHIVAPILKEEHQSNVEKVKLLSFIDYLSSCI